MPELLFLPTLIPAASSRTGKVDNKPCSLELVNGPTQGFRASGGVQGGAHTRLCSYLISISTLITFSSQSPL